MLLLVAVTSAVYWPGLRGPFVADDMPNFVGNPLVQVDALTLDELSTAARSNRSGPVGRLLPGLSFGLNYWFAGRSFAHLPFKLTNLAIHLLNALLALLLARRLLRAGGQPAGATLDWLAGAAVLIWALHPLQLTNVLYVVQRINSMATLFSLLGLLVFLSGRERLRDGRPGAVALMLAGIGGGTALGLACKENAVLLPAFALVLELCLYRGAVASPAGRRFLHGFYVLTVLLPALLALGLGLHWQEAWTHTYRGRDFDMLERLYTQPLVLWWYVRQLLLPDLSQLSLYHDDFPISRGLLAPPLTLLALLAWLGLIALAVWSWRRGPWLALAVGWFLVGHSLEASVVPLELVYEHRNYLPSLGLFIALVALLAGLVRRLNLPSRLPAALTVMVILVLAGATFSRASVWADAPTLAGVGVANNPDSARAHATQAVLLTAMGEGLDRIYPHYARAAQLAPRALDARVGMLQFVVLLQASELPAGDDPAALLRGLDGEVLLRLTPAALAAERARLDAEIRTLLADDVLGVGSVASVRGVVECVEQGAPRCVALLPELRGWLDAAAGNPWLDTHALQTMVWLDARTHLAAGDVERAVDTMDRAVALRPQFLTLRHQRVALLLRAGRVEQAADELAELAGLEGGSEHREALRFLEERLSESRPR